MFTCVYTSKAITTIKIMKIASSPRHILYLSVSPCHPTPASSSSSTIKPQDLGGGLFCFCHSRLISRVSHTENHRVSIPLGAGFIQAPTEGHLDCCQLGAIRSKAALNIPVHVFVRTYISLTAGKYPDVRGVNHIHYVVCTFNTFKKPPSFFPRFLGHVTFPQTI